MQKTSGSTGTVATERRVVWSGMELREERNAANQGVKRFEAQGVQHLFPGTAKPEEKYYYTRDHLGSIREVVTSKKGAWARGSYDPWGRRTNLSREHVSPGGSGYRQHFFTGATNTLPVGTGEKLAYV